MPRIVRWPPYLGARRRYRARLDEFDAALFRWVISIAVAEIEGRGRDHLAGLEHPRWVELGEFELLVRALVDRDGALRRLDLLDLRAIR